MMSQRPIVLAVVAALLAACGTSGASEGKASGSPVSTSSPGPQASSGGRIEVSAVWTGPEAEAFKKVLDAFKKKTGIAVTYSPAGDNPAAVLGPRASGGDAPDVAILPQPGLMADFHAQGFLTPVDEDTVSAVEENYDPMWRELGTIDGELYGVFFKAANKSLIWFNTGLFERVGAQPPERWRDFDTVAGKLEPSGVPLMAVGGADGWVLTDWFENIYAATAGPEKYEQLATRQLSWDDPSVRAALERMAGLLTDGSLVATDVADTLQTDFPTSAAMPFGKPPEAAMAFAGDFAAGVISDAGAEPGKAADFVPFPRIGERDPAVIVGGDIAVMMRDSDGAKKFLSFLASPEAAEVWAKEGGFISPNESLPLDAYGDPVSKRAAKMIQDAQTVAFDLSDRQPSAFGAQVDDGLYKLLQDLLGDPGSLDEVVAELETQAAEAYRQQEEAATSSPDDG